MTEQQNTSTAPEENRDSVEITSPPQKPVKHDRKINTALALSAVAIAIALAAGIGLYNWSKHQSAVQSATIEALEGQVTALQQQQETQKSALEKTLKQQAGALDAAKHEQENLTRQLDEMQQKVATISGTDAKNLAAGTG